MKFKVKLLAVLTVFAMTVSLLTVGGMTEVDAATKLTSKYEFLLNDNLEEIEVVTDEASDSDTSILYDNVVYLQYKAEADGEYTVRIVYRIAEGFISDFNVTSVGIKVIKDEVEECIYGTTLYSSIIANGEIMSVANCAFVVIEITDVPADAKFAVSPVQKYSYGLNEDRNYNVDMAAILGTN